MDDEVLAMINEQYRRAKDILNEHKEGHKQLADLLFTKEVIYAEDVEKIFGKRPWVSRTEELIKENDKLAQEKEAGEQSEAPRLEDMPDIVKQAQAEHEAATSADKEARSVDSTIAGTSKDNVTAEETSPSTTADKEAEQAKTTTTEE